MTGPVSFRVVVAAGTQEWTVTNETEPTLGLRDGLQITRSTPEEDISPSQPNPAVLKFGIVAESVGDIVPDIDRGVQIRAAVYLPADADDLEPAERFAGRIADLDVVPHPRGVLINVTAVDYLADLAELPDYDRAQNGYAPNLGRLTSLFEFYGMDAPPRLPHDGHAASGVGPDTNVYNGTFPECIEGYLRQWVPDLGPVAGRYVLLPQLVADGGRYLDADDPYVLLPIATPGNQRGWRDAYPIAASRVDTNGAFNRTKADAPDVVDVTYYDPADYESGGAPGESSTASAGTGPIRTNITTLLAEETDAQSVANIYLPPEDTDGAVWRVDSFTWHLKNEPPGTYLPNPEPNIPGAYLGGPVDIIGLDSRWSPVGYTYKGILAGYTLTIERARPTVELDLQNSLP